MDDEHPAPSVPPAAPAHTEDIAPSPAARVPAVRVVIATTNGPVTIQNLWEEDEELGRSSVIIGGTTTRAGIDKDYSDFVRPGSGIIARQFGHAAFLLDISDRVDIGLSWQLAVFLAHAVLAGGRLAQENDSCDVLVWATGGVRSVNLDVTSVGHVADKLRNSTALFEATVAAGTPVHIFVPRANADEPEPATTACLQARGLVVTPLDRVDEALRLLGLPLPVRAAAPAEARWSGNPYRGLAAFDEGHRAVFFGRGKAREECVALLRQAAARGHAFLLVYGRSGSGKSSLARAGLAGDVAAQADEGGSFATAAFTPRLAGDGPLGALAAALNRLVGRSEAADVGLLAELRGDCDGALRHLEREINSGAGKRSGLLVIDQLEELFAGTAPHPDMALFAGSLERLARGGVVWLVATMRSDLIGGLDQAPALARLASRERSYRLDRPRRHDLVEIITAPAALAGLRFAAPEGSPSLPEALADVAEASADSLPLLEFVLSRLYEQTDRRGTLTFAAYERLGGFDGAVARRADETAANLLAGGVAEAHVDRALLSLVRIDAETGRPLTRPVPLSTIDEEQLAVLRPLAEARLVSFDGEGGRQVARLAHEVLISAWPRLRTLAERLRDLLALRDRLGEAAAIWLASDRDEADLLRGARVEEAAAFTAQHLVAVPSGTTNYVEASATYARREAEREKAALAREHARIADVAVAQRRTKHVIWAIAALTLIGAVVVTWQFASNSNLTRSLITKGVDLEHKEATLLGQLAKLDLANGGLDTALRLATRGTRIDASLTPDLLSTSLARSTLASIAPQSREQLVLSGHTGAVRAVAFSPDGSVFLTGSGKSVKIWDAHANRILRTLSTQLYVDAAAFSPDGKRIVIASDIMPVAEIWDVDSGKQGVVLRGHSIGIHSVAFSADGAQVATGGADHTIRIWESASGRELRRWDAGSEVESVALSPDGKHLLAATSEVAAIWDIEAGVVTKQLAAYLVRSAAYNHDGTRAVICKGASVLIVDLIDDHLGPFIDQKPYGCSVAQFSQDGTRIVAASNDYDFSPYEVVVWDAWSGSRLAVLRAHEAQVTAVAFDPSGAHVLSGARDATARFWDLTNDVPLKLRGHDQGVLVARFSHDGSMIATTSADGTIRLWDAASGQLLQRLTIGPAWVTGAAFSPDDHYLATAHGDGTVVIWDPRSGRREMRIKAHQSAVNAIDYSADGTFVVTASDDKTARIWRANTGEVAGVLVGHDGHVEDVSFSADSHNIVTTSAHSMRVWANGKTVLKIAGSDDAYFRSAHFSPDGTRIVTASTDAARVWDAGSGKELAVLRRHSGWVQSATYSKSGRLIVTSAADGTIVIWDAGSFQPVATLPICRDCSVTSVSFSPDEHAVVTGTNDTMASVWNVQFATRSTKQMLAMACERLLDGISTMTRDEMRLAGYADTIAPYDVCAGMHQ